jgi:hypothetical protein
MRGPYSADPVPGAAVRYPSPTNGAVRIVRPGASATTDDRFARSRPERRPDATETTPPQGDSPALQSAPELLWQRW